MVVLELPKMLGGRAYFGDLLNERGLLGSAIEIGVYEGAFADIMLRTWNGRRYWMVDPYLPGYDPEDPLSCANMLAARAKADTVARQHKGRAEMLDRPSLEACRHVSELLDFVYIDANHQYPSVRADLHAWWQKLAPGGILAGHDFLCPGEVGGGWGPSVQAAVFEFCELMDVEKLFLVPELDNQPWSFFLEKP